ncbi:hypothetical protein [Streptomyces mangrovisoli]|uniref:Integral membrane protein n=1 Tax=Streptomyces mangrovisoli TaxID=1428628 RepID=A0A1J4P7S7_9ACTN|nr:hypothetical protein [Streptomyces mangrovisoli]OIJ69574.1 hypothetical protein WN71_001435 [Streptomyces mangrovisoli]
MSSRLRGGLSAALIALACLLVPFGALAAWAAYGLTDGERWVATLAPLSRDPDVRDAIADTVGDGLAREVSVAGPAGRDVPAFVHDAVRSFTRTPAFATAWDAGNRATHDAVLRALRDGRTGSVTVDLAPVTAQVKDQLAHDHVPLASRIPVEHTEVAVLPAQDLDRLRKGFHVLEVAGFWLPVSAVVLAAAGIALSVHRRRAIVATALGTALGGALLGLSLAIGRMLTLEDLPTDVSRAAVGAVYDALTGTLRTCAWLLLALGVTVAVGTRFSRYLRPDRLLRARRGSAAPAPAPAQPPTRVRA